MTLRTILIAHQDEDTQALLREALREDGYRIISAASADEALMLIRRMEPDLLILDTETDGFAVLERREGRARDVPVILMGAAIPELASDGRVGAQDEVVNIVARYAGSEVAGWGCGCICVVLATVMAVAMVTRDPRKRCPSQTQRPIYPRWTSSSPTGRW